MATRSLDCASSLVLGRRCVVFGASLTSREPPWLGSLTFGLGLDSASRFPIRLACQWLIICNILPKNTHCEPFGLVDLESLYASEHLELRTKHLCRSLEPFRRSWALNSALLTFSPGNPRMRFSGLLLYYPFIKPPVWYVSLEGVRKIQQAANMRSKRLRRKTAERYRGKQLQEWHL